MTPRLPEEVPRDFYILQAIAHGAGVQLRFVDLADGTGEEGVDDPDDGDDTIEFSHPALSLPVAVVPQRRIRWELSPWAGYGVVGYAAGGRVLWDLERALALEGEPSNDIPAFVGLLHEIAHAATGHDGYLGSEDSASAWETYVAGCVWGWRSREVRQVRVWGREAGVSTGDLRAAWRWGLDDSHRDAARHAVAFGRAALELDSMRRTA